MKFLWNELKKDYLELKKKKGFIFKLPSIITSFRLLCTILIPLFVAFSLPIPAIITVITGSLSDAVDGKIARKYNAISNFGAKLDAICDKLFIGSLSLSLIIILPFIGQLLTTLSLINEAIITKINCQKTMDKNNVKTTSIGRIKMVSLCCSLLLGFLTVLLPILAIPALCSGISTLILQYKTIKSYQKEAPVEIKEPEKQSFNIYQETPKAELEKQLLYTLKAILDKETNEQEMEKQKKLSLR